MLRNIFFLGLLTLAIGTTVGCGKRADDPQPNCYGGTVVGATCMNGVLIDVDPAQAIGAPAYRHGANGDVLLGRNVIAVINSQDLNPVLRPGTANNPSAIGQRLYFIIASDPTGEGPRCLAADGVKGNVPRLGLENVSTTGCQSEGIWFCGAN